MEDGRQPLAHGTDPARYRSYLLRLWREDTGRPWRCQVQCVASGQVRRFDDQAGLFAFLVAELDDIPRAGARDDDIGPAGTSAEGGDARQAR